MTINEYNAKYEKHKYDNVPGPRSPIECPHCKASLYWFLGSHTELFCRACCTTHSTVGRLPEPRPMPSPAPTPSPALGAILYLALSIILAAVFYFVLVTK